MCSWEQEPSQPSQTLQTPVGMTNAWTPWWESHRPRGTNSIESPKTQGKPSLCPAQETLVSFTATDTWKEKSMGRRAALQAEQLHSWERCCSPLLIFMDLLCTPAAPHPPCPAGPRAEQCTSSQLLTHSYSFQKHLKPCISSVVMMSSFMGIKSQLPSLGDKYLPQDRRTWMQHKDCNFTLLLHLLIQCQYEKTKNRDFD